MREVLGSNKCEEVRLLSFFSFVYWLFCCFLCCSMGL